jgi:hypothetical protein
MLKSRSQLCCGAEHFGGGSAIGWGDRRRYESPPWNRHRLGGSLRYESKKSNKPPTTNQQPTTNNHQQITIKK